MSRLNFLTGLFLLFLSACISGCITDAAPDPDQTLYMDIGDVQAFSVKGASSSDATYFEWYINIKGGLEHQDSTYGETSSSFEFTVDPAYVNNKLSVVCEQIIPIPNPLVELLGWPNYFPATADTVTWYIEVNQAPPVWQGDYVVETEDDILFLEQGGYDEITGDLIVTGDDLTVITEFNSIKSVVGSIVVKYTSRLESIDGLDGITSVGGDLIITGNDALAVFNGPDNLGSINGDLNIEGNDSLAGLDGFENLTSINGNVDISRNKSLETLEGLARLSSVVGYVFIGYNESLINLEDLENIVTIGDSLYISSNDSLTGLGLSRLYSIGLDFDIHSNAALCTYLAEDLRDQVQEAGGIGRNVDITDNKDCTAL